MLTREYLCPVVGPVTRNLADVAVDDPGLLQLTDRPTTYEHPYRYSNYFKSTPQIPPRDVGPDVDPVDLGLSVDWVQTCKISKSNQ
jgi:hypothetical protein